MKLRTFFYGLIATVVALLLVGMGGVYWLTAHSPLKLLRGGGQASPAATIFVPRQAPMMASLLVNPEQLEAFRLAIAPSGERRQARAELAQLKQTLLINQGLEYGQDIQPWLGDEITFAVTTVDIDRDPSNGLQPGYLLAIATQNPQRSREFLQLFWQKRAVGGTDLVFEQYAGVKIIYGNPAAAPMTTPTKSQRSVGTPDLAGSIPPIPRPSLASAVVGDRFVLFANHPKVLRDAITNVQAADLNLSHSQDYQDALDHLPNRQMGTLFVNLPQLGKWLGVQPDALAATADEGNSSPVYKSLVMALQPDRQGLLAQTVLLTMAEQSVQQAKPALSKPVEALNYIPANSPLSAAGIDLRHLWEQLMTGGSDSSFLAAILKQPLASLQARWGIELSSDLVSWVQGEYALGLLPAAPGGLSEWIFVAQRSPETTAAIERLDGIARQHGLSVGPLDLDTHPVFAWTKLSATPTTSPKSGAIALQAEVQGVHATVEDYEIFATSAAAMTIALNATQNSLLTTADFQKAIAPLDHSNDGYLYIDWQVAGAMIEQQLPLLKLTTLIAKPLFEHLRSIAISSYGSEATLHRGAIFVRLQNS